jgi:hypothetical protein
MGYPRDNYACMTLAIRSVGKLCVPQPREKALSLAVAQIERPCGKGAIMRLGAQPAALDIAVIRPRYSGVVIWGNIGTLY